MWTRRESFKSGLISLLIYTNAWAGGVPKPNVFIISIGLNDYSSIQFVETISVRFDHSESDAQSFTNAIRRYAEGWTKTKYNIRAGAGTPKSESQIGKVYDYQLYGDAVSWSNIQAAIDSVSIQAKPNDYLFFMFSGLSLQTTAGTYFMPKITTKTTLKINSYETISDSATIAFIKKHGFSLAKLAERLELIPAQNQLIVSEAGASSEFAREMVSILRAQTPDVHRLSQRNRVIVVPAKIGLDPGPLARWISQMPSNINIFDLFTARNWVSVLNYFYSQDNSGYATFFFESQFFKQLNDYLPAQNRGSQVVSDPKERINRQGKTHALVIGIDRFPRGWPDWKPLSNPINDARKIAEELRQTYGMETRFLINVATDSILATLKHYHQYLTQDDQLLIYVASHGDIDTVFFDDGFLVGVNTLPIAKDPTRSTYLNYAQLSRIIDHLPGRHVLLMLDVCYGGAFNEKVIKQAQKRERSSLSIADEKFLIENTGRKSRQFITSALLSPVPDGDLINGQHSPFAFRLLNALRRDNVLVSASEIFGQIQENANPQPYYSVFGRHEEGGEFIFLRKGPKP